MAKKPLYDMKFQPSNSKLYFTRDFLTKHVDLEGKGKKASEDKMMARLAKHNKAMEKGLKTIEANWKLLYPNQGLNLKGRGGRLFDEEAVLEFETLISQMEADARKLADAGKSKTILDQLLVVRKLRKMLRGTRKQKTKQINSVLVLEKSDLRMFAEEIHDEGVKLIAVSRKKNNQPEAKPSKVFTTNYTYPVWKRGTKDEARKAKDIKRSTYGGEVKVKYKVQHDEKLGAYVAFHLDPL